MVPHQDLVSLLSQPAPAHMAALAAQKGGPGCPPGVKDQVVQGMPQSAARCHHHQRVPSGGAIPGSERLSGTGSDRLSTGSDRLSSGSQRRASQGSVGSPRHHSQGALVGLTQGGGGSEELQHRPTKMTPVIPVTTEVTKQITEVQNKKPNIQRIPPQQHPPQRVSLDGPPNTGSMDLPPPPPEMMIAPLSAHEAVLSAEPPPASYPAGSGDFPLPPPPSSMEQYGRPAPQASAGSQPGSNRSSTSSSSMGLPPSPASQSPRHSVHQSSPRHSVSVRPPMMAYGSPTAAPSPPPPPPAPTMSSPLHHAPPPTPPTPSAMTASMPGSPQNQPMSPSNASLQHRRSSSGPSTPTRKPPPPPPPRRSDTTHLSQYAETSTGRYFMADLSRVLTLKQGRSQQFMQRDDPPPEFPPAPPPLVPLPQPHYTSVENDDFSDLPPPPEELLEGLPGHEKRKPPPPPPKRHLQTQLSFSRGQIS